MARIVPTILLHFLHPWRSDVGGTTPWQALFLQCFCISSVHGGQMGEVERSRSQSREQCRSNCRGVLEGTSSIPTEDKPVGAYHWAAARLQGKDCSYNPVAFPPSLEVRCRRYDPMDGGGRAKQEARAESNAGAIADDYMDVGGRATQGAVAEQNVGAISGLGRPLAPRHLTTGIAPMIQASDIFFVAHQQPQGSKTRRSIPPQALFQEHERARDTQPAMDTAEHR